MWGCVCVCLCVRLEFHNRKDVLDSIAWNGREDGEEAAPST